MNKPETPVVADQAPPPRRARQATAASAPARLTWEHHVAVPGARHYLLFTPPSTPSSRKTRRPLVIMLHGCNQNAAEFAQATRMNQYASRYDACVAYPTQSPDANAGQCWNWYDAAHQRRAGGEPAILADLTRHLIATLDIDPGRVFVAGFSAGGAMAATLAVLYPELYAALGVHSGVAHGAVRDFLSALFAMQHPELASHAPHPMHEKIPTIVFHGDSDNMIHAAHADPFIGAVPATGSLPSDRWRIETVAPHAEKHGYTRTIRLDERQQSFSELWLVHGGRHAWSGGDATAGHVDPNGPDAAAEMMRFFAGRTR